MGDGVSKNAFEKLDDARAENAELRAVVRPFAEAYRLFRAAGMGTKLPADVAGAICMQDFARAAEVLRKFEQS